MRSQRKVLVASLLFLVVVLIHLYSSNEVRVENNYSTGFFPGFARGLRQCLGGFRISIGDLLYGGAVVWIFYKIGRLILLVYRRKQKGLVRQKLKKNLYGAFIVICALYIIFNLFWGINYDRKGIAWQLGLDTARYSPRELAAINLILVGKINESKTALLRAHRPYPSNRELFRLSTEAYKNASLTYPFLSYAPASIKSSIWGWLGNYTGFTGYYNPFTGEAQVNTTVPKFTQPYTTCHEVAHQLGYAKEMEANFVGYLAASASKDTLFHYSVYLDLFTYANRNLYFIDSSASRVFRDQLRPEVETDIREWIEFSRRHKNPVGPVIRWMYGIYLQGNRQPQGIMSYDEVTGFIIAYYKKFGRI